MIDTIAIVLGLSTIFMVVLLGWMAYEVAQYKKKVQSTVRLFNALYDHRYFWQSWLNERVKNPDYWIDSPEYEPARALFKAIKGQF